VLVAIAPAATFLTLTFLGAAPAVDRPGMSYEKAK
jgi:hypothetical protein